MEIAEDRGRSLYEAIKEWVKQFDEDSLTITVGGATKNADWEIRIDHPVPKRSKAWVVWSGDPVQVCLGDEICVERLEDDPEVILQFLDAAANGLITERVRRRGGQTIWSEAEIQLRDEVWRESRAGPGPLFGKTAPDEIIGYEPWLRRTSD